MLFEKKKDTSDTLKKYLMYVIFFSKNYMMFFIRGTYSFHIGTCVKWGILDYMISTSNDIISSFSVRKNLKIDNFIIYKFFIIILEF